MKILSAIALTVVLALPIYSQGGMGPGPGLGKPPGSGGGGSDFVNATFTVGSDTTLASYTGETGAAFTSHPSYSGTILVDASLDRIYLNSAASAAYTTSGVPSSADYCVKATFFNVTSISSNIAIILGMDTTADTGILLRMNVDVTRFEVLDRVAGSNGTAVTSSTHFPSPGNSVIAEMCRAGTAVTVTFGGTPDAALNFTTGITAIGRAGLRFAGTASSTTGPHIDNFSAR